MSARNNLPAQLTRLIGRDRDVASITRRLETTRLLTLTGAGGSGKTRLALAVAADVARLATDAADVRSDIAPADPALADGVWLVELAALADPALVPQAIADAVGIRESSDRSVVAGLLAGLAHRELLVVLDNCEHLAQACAEAAAAILRACPRIRILATSQVALGVPGEVVWPVPLLQVPAVDEVASAEAIASIERFGAVHLFVERAHAADPSFGVNAGNARSVVDICRRLDGMPLAIELAAARVRALSVPQIAARLDDAFSLLSRGGRVAPPRHQTLRAAIDWSHDLLGVRERAVFRRLAVFAGGFTLEAAEEVVGDVGDDRAGSVSRSDVLDVLTDLVDRSLVVAERTATADGRRYRLLETLRQFAAGQLESAGETRAVRGRLIAWCAVLAESAAPELRGNRQKAWLDRLAAEHDNLRQALRWAIGDPDWGARGGALAAALAHFWRTHGHLSEGRAWIDAALASASGDDALRATLLYRAGDFALLQADYARARAAYDEAVALFRAIGDGLGEARLLNDLGALASAQGDFTTSQRLRTESLDLLREHGDRLAMADVLNSLGGESHIHGDAAQARRLFAESLALCREIGDLQGTARALRNLGLVAMNEGGDDEARGHFAESLALCEQIDDRRAAAHCLHTMAHLALNAHDCPAARAHLDRSQAIWRAIGDPHNYAYGLQMLASASLAERDAPAAAAEVAESLALLADLSDPWGTAMSIGKMADVAVLAGDIGMALRMYAAAERWVEATGAALPAAARVEYEKHLATLSDRVGSDVFARAMAEGRALSVEEAVALATGYVPSPPSSAPSEPSSLPIDAALSSTIAATSALTSSTAMPSISSDAGAELRIEALGPARVLRAGAPIAASDWTYAKARELLFFLLEHRERSREQIGLVFWPDADAGQLRSSLGTVLKHLRRALGDPGWIVFEGDRYRFDRARDYRYDVEAFERRLSAARAAVDDPAVEADHLAAALALWRGEYLEDMTVEWVVDRRADLDRVFVGAALRLGDIRLAADDAAGAADAFRRALDRDPYLETAHRGLMRAYAGQGERNQALRHYHALVERLRDELGAAPDSETAALAGRLRVNS